MSSAAQAAANAANARLSTGPATAAGKARSAPNALRHGLTAKEVIVREDQREQFEDLRDSLLTELDPRGALETVTFNQLVHAAWNLERCRSLEAGLAGNGLDPMLDESAAKTFDRLTRYAARAERSYYRAIQELSTLQTNRALRALELEKEQEAMAPAVVTGNELTKRTQSEIQADAMSLATEILNAEAATYVRQSRPGPHRVG